MIGLPRRLLAELLGTGPLVMVVVGSGIAAQQLSPGQAGPSHARRCDKLSRSCRMVPARRRRDGLIRLSGAFSASNSLGHLASSGFIPPNCARVSTGTR
jgi:hypothetical protein